MERFVLKVDLSAFFNNIYERVMILADPNWEYVSKAEKRIRKMFKIEGNIGFKSQEGFYIPSEEPIEILRHVDVLIAFKKLQASEKGDQNMSPKTEDNADSVKSVKPMATADFVRKKKRGRQAVNDVCFTTSTPTANLAKRLKSLDATEPNASLCSGEARISNINGNNVPLEKRANGNTNNSSECRSNTCAEDNERSTSNRSKNKNTPTLASKKESINKPNTHIFYKESDEDINPNNEQQEIQKKEIVFVCHLENTEQKKSRIFHIDKEIKNGYMDMEPNEDVSKNKSSNAISILENITLPKNTSIISENVSKRAEENKSMRYSQANESVENATINASKVSESQFQELSKSREISASFLSDDITYDESAVIELNDTECVTDSTGNQNTMNQSSQNISTEVNEFSVEAVLSRAKDLKGMPVVDDLIVFKMKLANGKISDYFVGQCEYVNKRTKTLKLQLKDGLSQTTSIPPKYTCNIDDSRNFNSINIKIQDMLDAKVCGLSF